MYVRIQNPEDRTVLQPVAVNSTGMASGEVRVFLVSIERNISAGLCEALLLGTGITNISVA